MSEAAVAAPATFRKFLRFIISRVLSSTKCPFTDNGRLVHHLYLYRTDEPRGHQSRRIFCRTGAKGSRLAQDHAVEERVGYSDFQYVLSRLHEVCYVGLVRTQKQRRNALAVDRYFGDIFHIAEVKDELPAGICCRYRESG